MKIHVRDAGKDVKVVEITGKIVLGEETAALRETVRGLLNQDSKKIVLDLGNVTHIDSSGLGELVSCYTTALNKGAQLKLMRLGGRVKELLIITKLLTVFGEDYADEQRAISSFA